MAILSYTGSYRLAWTTRGRGRAPAHPHSPPCVMGHTYPILGHQLPLAHQEQQNPNPSPCLSPGSVTVHGRQHSPSSSFPDPTGNQRQRKKGTGKHRARGPWAKAGRGHWEEDRVWSMASQAW